MIKFYFLIPTYCENIKTAVFEADKGIRPSDFNLGNVMSGVSDVCFSYMLKRFFGYVGIKQRV